MRYRSPKALEQAVKAAARRSGRDVGKAIAAFWRDRLLCRVFSTPEPEFVLKGGQGMLAKVPDARETRDIDLLGTSGNLDEALDELKALSSKDLGDYLNFRFETARPTDTSQDYRTGYTVTFEVWLGGTVKRGTVSVDLVVDTVPPGSYDMVDSISSLKLEGLETHPYAITKPASRVAEKVGATMQDYGGNPSSRVKDLADLVKTMCVEDVDAVCAPRRPFAESGQYRHSSCQTPGRRRCRPTTARSRGNPGCPNATRTPPPLKRPSPPGCDPSSKARPPG